MSLNLFTCEKTSNMKKYVMKDLIIISIFKVNKLKNYPVKKLETKKKLVNYKHNTCNQTFCLNNTKYQSLLLLYIVILYIKTMSLK